MAKDKYDFISEILENKKLTPIQREKVFMLSALELKKDKLEGLELEERIIKIENILKIAPQTNVEQEFVNKSTTLESDPSKISSSTKKYINPSNLSKFLEDYNKDHILKTTCHEIDDNELANILEIIGEETYNFEKHYEAIIKAFTKLENKYFVEPKVKALIRGYLTGNNFYNNPIKGWSTNTIKINWNCTELREWAQKNPGIPPNPDKILRRQFNTLGFRFDEIPRLGINSFLNLVIHFKKLFHIRDDNSLKSIIQEINSTKNLNEKIEFEISDELFRSNIEFFTDVDKLKQAYNIIIEIILEIVENKNLTKPIIKVSLIEENDSIFFSVHHLNSVFAKTAQNLINRIGQKHANLINNQINGMCDLYVKADFGFGNFAEINLWDSEKERKVTEIDSFKGVEHILVFRK